MEKNIRDFNRFTAMLMERLYESFPNPVIISIEDFDDSADRETLKTYASSMEFLKDEGFIRYSKVTTDNVFMNVVLTAKGLTLLNLVPEGIAEKKSLIQQIKEVLKEGSKVAVKSVVEALLKESLR